MNLKTFFLILSTTAIFAQDLTMKPQVLADGFEQHHFRYLGKIVRGCTGVLIGPRHVLTAAHCIYDHPSRTFETDLNFILNMSSKDQFGDDKFLKSNLFRWKRAFIPKAFKEAKSQEAGKFYEYAVIELEDAVSSLTDFPRPTKAGNLHQLIIAGYAKNFGQYNLSYSIGDAIRFGHYNHRKDQILFSTASSNPGGSGAPVIPFGSQSNEIIGIFVGRLNPDKDPIPYSRIRIIDDEVLDSIEGWRRGEWDERSLVLENDSVKEFRFMTTNCERVEIEVLGDDSASQTEFEIVLGGSEIVVETLSNSLQFHALGYKDGSRFLWGDPQNINGRTLYPHPIITARANDELSWNLTCD